MPQYLAPGVYVEEISFQPNSIGGASTTVTGFIGATSFGPAYGVPELLTSFSDFQNIYGGLDPLQFEDAGETIGYLAQAVRAFFQNGGQQLYVVRAFSSVARGTEGSDSEDIYDPQGLLQSQQTACCAQVSIEDTSSSPPVQAIPIFARYPGSYGNVIATFTFSAGQNVLSGMPHDPLNPAGPKDPTLQGVHQYDTVWISQNESSPAQTGLYWADNYLNPVTKQWDWQFQAESGAVLPLSALVPKQTGITGDTVKVVTVTVEVEFPGAFPRTVTYPGLTFHPLAPTSLSQFFAQQPSSRSAALTVPLIFDPQGLFTDGPTIARILMTQPRSTPEIGRLKKLLGIPITSPPTPGPDLSIFATLGSSQLANSDRQLAIVLSEGLDGFWPTPRYYEGTDTYPNAKTGLIAFEDLTDISIVAAPGSTAPNTTIDSDLDTADKLTIAGLLITHCEQMLYRVAILDSILGQDLTDISEYRGQLDSEYAALYYPWVLVDDLVSETEISLPPSSFVAGLYVDNDIQTGVHKAPANMVVQLALGFEVMLNKSQQDLLNPLGIDCFRFFENRGYRLWGARTISSNSQWQYVNIRRYFCYLEHSIDLGTQWVVFEPNSEALWARVVTAVTQFLLTEFQSGRLMGAKPAEAFFVTCDRSTMTQDDIDQGRLICVIGVAPIYPAEFVIFQIGQWAGSQAS
jgi:phage tail sheath protein FI